MPAIVKRQSPGKISLMSGTASPIFQPNRCASPLPTMQELRSAMKSFALPCWKRRSKTSSAVFGSMAKLAKKFLRSL